jgi:hypothetical protein
VEECIEERRGEKEMKNQLQFFFYKNLYRTIQILIQRAAFPTHEVFVCCYIFFLNVSEFFSCVYEFHGCMYVFPLQELDRFSYLLVF